MPDTAEKIMSLTLADFHRSIKALAPDLVAQEGQTTFTVVEGDTDVLIRYEPLEKATLGGLLAMPRARVTIEHGNLDTSRCKAFLARFDRAFQRGGG
ncbi:MAG: hypothetical protein MPJ78_17895 [Hyphomicrobiaceae bacterium]|nr:hypothetical protein [Hyphomicrobiaceae bacterium]